MSKLLTKKIHKTSNKRKKVGTKKVKKPRIRRTDVYREYLKTQKWRDIRQVVAERDGYTCCKCGKVCTDHYGLTGFQVHHTTYRYIYNEEEHLECLMFLCKACHEAVTDEIKSMIENRETAKKKHRTRVLRSRAKKETEPKTITPSKA